MKYFCKICSKEYKSSQSLWNHNNKFHNNEIKEEITYKCKSCNLSFDNRQKKYYHQKKCTKNLENDDLKKDKKYEQEKTNITNISNNISNSQINSNNTIIINNYKNDNLEYISDKFKNIIFNQLIDEEDHHLPISKLIENIKFNPNHKENNNIKITSDRSKIGFYYDKNKWMAINKDELLEELCEYGFKIFKNFFNEKKSDLDYEIINQFKNFQVRLKSEFRKKIKKKIENIAYIFTKNNLNDLDV
jgi:hypothetical protein